MPIAFSVPLPIAIPLVLAMGAFWTVTYILIIRRGFKDAAVGMPIGAFCMNIAWEVTFSFIYPDIPINQAINIVWFLFDLGIVAQILWFGTRNLQSSLGKKLLHPSILLGMTGAFIVLLPIARHYGGTGAVYSGVVINAVMSVLFVVMLIQRNSIAGQSMYIALFKWLGTLAACLPILGHRVVQVFYPIIFTFDMAYLLILYTMTRREGLSPWSRA